MIESVLTLSTNHITKEDVEMLSKKENSFIAEFNYGFFLFTEPVLNLLNMIDNKYSKAFKEVVSLASQLNCQYICLDRDADCIDELQTFDW